MEENKKDIKKESDKQLSISGLDSYFEGLCKKTDKIATAVFMVTDSMSDSDDLKRSIRQKVLGLMSLTKSVAFSRTEDLTRILSDMALNFQELRSLIELSGIMDYISQMNAEILLKEISNVIESISTKTASYGLSFGYKLAKTFVLDPNIFGDTEFYNNENVSHKGQMSFKKIDSKNSIKTGYKRQEKQINRDNLGGLNEPRKDRREQIMELIKDKKNATIKDISLVMNGCSEKTIQRELADMILGGVLDRKGERRWSTYSIKNS